MVWKVQTQLAGADVEGADIARRGAVALVGGGAEDQQVFKDAARGGGLDQAEGGRIAAESFLEITTRPLAPKTGDQACRCAASRARSV